MGTTLTTTTVHCIAVIREVPCIKSECTMGNGEKPANNLDVSAICMWTVESTATEATWLNNTLKTAHFKARYNYVCKPYLAYCNDV